MLVLTRKVGERIVVADEVIVEVVQVQGSRVKLGIVAPSNVPIVREELTFRPKQSAGRPDEGVASGV